MGGGGGQMPPSPLRPKVKRNSISSNKDLLAISLFNSVDTRRIYNFCPSQDSVEKIW